LPLATTANADALDEWLRVGILDIQEKFDMLMLFSLES
jgi:hypothetical protein